MDSPFPEMPTDNGDESIVISSPPKAAALDSSEEIQAPSDTSEEQQTYHRALRPLRGLKRSTAVAWYDQDDTGDFDPQEEARRLRPPKKKLRSSIRNTYEDGENDTSNMGIGFKPQPQPQSELNARLIFRSSIGKAAFRKRCAAFQSEVKSARDNFAEGYQLRKRKSAAEHGSLDQPGTGVTTLSKSPFDLPDDLSNHPAARGCYGCLAMGLKCSLLDNEHQYPCDDCTENGDDCQLVTEPLLKMACTHCQYLGKRQKWLVCSFDYEEGAFNHRGSCHRCNEDGHQPCIAGPRPGQTRTRVRIHWDGEKYAPYTNQPSSFPKTPRSGTCRQCLEAERLCSFASGDSRDVGDTCTACDMSGALCEPLGTHKAPQRRLKSRSHVATGDEINELENFEESFVKDRPERDHPERPGANKRVVPSSSKINAPGTVQDRYAISLSPEPPRISARTEKPKKSRDTSKAISLSSGSQTSNKGKNAKDPICISPDPPEKSAGITRTVRTHFCHPIQFQTDDTSSKGPQFCHFCSSAQFSILGLEEKKVKIMDRDNGSGWTEISGGHRSDGVQCTQVCADCTRARLDMTLCIEHDLRRIAGSGGVDFETAFERLLAAGSTVKERWCSVCCNLAVWECQTTQQGKSQDAKGCGLALCGYCRRDLAARGGIFDIMLREMADEPSEERPGGLRADYGLLKQDGLLMKYVFR